jgi:ABC-type nickel/cobalt efflux system permease component RcnA
METQGHPSRQPIAFGLSLVAGGGLVLMMIALGVGVVNTAAADGGLVGTLFITGLLLLITGIGAWIAYTRPFDHFDDIEQPKDAGHGHDHDQDAQHADEAVLLPDGMVETPALPSGEQQATHA